MNKKLIALAVAGAFAGYGAAANAAEVSGFAVVNYVLVDDAAEKASSCTPSGASSCANSKEGKFSTEAEVDISATPAEGVTVRVDTDLSLYTGDRGSALDANDDGTVSAGEMADFKDTNSDTVTLEQAFFAWDLTHVTLIGGVFNNPIGQEAEDAADWNFATSSMIRKSLDNQTELNGNNVAGVAVAGAAGPVTLTGALLNHLGGANDENSLALVANYSPIAGLDLELGMVTQESETNGDTTAADNVGDVMNFNAQYDIAPVAGLTVGLDYTTYDKIADTAYNIWGTYAIPGTKFSVGLRLEQFGWETPANDVERTSFNVAYKAASNLKIYLDVSDASGAGCLASAPTPAAGTGCNLDFGGDDGLARVITGAQTDVLTKVKLVATF